MTTTVTTAEQNAAAVAAIYEAFGRGDLPALLDHLADDIAWDTDPDAAAEAGVRYLKPRRGPEEVAGFFGDLAEDVEITAFAVRDVIASGTKAVAEIDISLTVRATGRSLDDRELHHWEFGPDGRVVRFSHHVDTARHLWAAGLTSPGR